MQDSFELQTSDLENSQSVLVQELTDEEAEKIGGGCPDDPGDPGDPDPDLWPSWPSWPSWS